MLRKKEIVWEIGSDDTLFGKVYIGPTGRFAARPVLSLNPFQGLHDVLAPIRIIGVFDRSRRCQPVAAAPAERHGGRSTRVVRRGDVP